MIKSGNISNPISDSKPRGNFLTRLWSVQEKMIEEEKKVNNEYYVCPVYNEAIEDGKKIKIFDIPRMWGLGTPEDLDYFLKYFGREKDDKVKNPNE